MNYILLLFILFWCNGEKPPICREESPVCCDEPPICREEPPICREEPSICSQSCECQDICNEHTDEDCFPSRNQCEVECNDNCHQDNCDRECNEYNHPYDKEDNCNRENHNEYREECLCEPPNNIPVNGYNSNYIRNYTNGRYSMTYPYSRNGYPMQRR